MTIAHEEPRQLSKPCRFFHSIFKDAFPLCCLTQGFEEDASVNDIDEEQEVLIQTIRRAMEMKTRRKGRLMGESFQWGEGDVVGAPKEMLCIGESDDSCTDEDDDDEEKQEYFSMKSCFSRCSSGSKEALFSARSCFSRCSSGSRIELWDFRRRSMTKEFCQCQGWPFGLYRKALLLPPLPKSPSESWSWRRGTKLVKMG